MRKCSFKNPKIMILIMALVFVLSSCAPAAVTSQSSEDSQVQKILGNHDGSAADTLSGVMTLEKKISIVFLGSADEAIMQRLTDLLNRYGVRATFFLPGINVSENPQIARNIKEKGYGLGNYSLDGGEEMDQLPREDSARKLYRAQTIYRNAVSEAPSLFTCDSTKYTEELLQTAKACGLTYAIQPNKYLNQFSFSKEVQAQTYVQNTDWGAVIAVKIGRELTDEEIGEKDEEVLEPAVDKQPTDEAAPTVELPENQDERMLLITEWLLKAYSEQGYQFVTPTELQGYKNTSMYRDVADDPDSIEPIKVISNAATTQKGVALTFQVLGSDDKVVSLLDTLDELKMVASFFVTGQEAIERAPLIKEIASRGHSIQSSGFLSRGTSKLSFQECCSDLIKSMAAIEETIGKTPRLYRPIHGEISENMAKACRAVGLIPVLYNKNPLPEDGKSLDDLLKYFSKGFHRGDIIYLRTDNYYKLDGLVKGIAALVYDTGYSFKTIEDIYDHQYVMKPLEEIAGWDAIKTKNDFDPKASIAGKSLTTVPVKDKTIFLTFDDWGSDKNVTRILDTLDEYNVKATFFIIGASAEKNPNLLRAIAEAGHDIANHTYYHKVITKISSVELQEEVVKCHQTLTQIIGREADLYFRPPTLEYDQATINAVLGTGFKYVLLSNISTQDYERNADEVVNYAVSSAENGGLIVMHLTDNSSGAQALPSIIEKLRAKGYKLAKLSDYLK